jgi:hypothetical protein
LSSLIQRVFTLKSFIIISDVNDKYSQKMIKINTPALKFRTVSLTSLLTLFKTCKMQILDGVVSIATSYGLDDGVVVVQVPVGSRIFSSPNLPDRLCCPPSLLSNGLFPREKSGRSVKLTTHLQLVPRLRQYGSIHPLPHTPSCHSA